MIKDSYISSETKSFREEMRLKNLALYKEFGHQSACRYSLVDFLTNKFEWHYWLVVTFGYNPYRSDVEQVLQNAHLRFDRWMLTNNKLEYIPVCDRSKWVCLPEYGDERNLHYNCFLQLNLKPQSKTYNNEWNAIRNALKITFKNLQEVFQLERKIEFRLYERSSKKDDWKMALYSTKEMTQNYINENNVDHLSNMILSWKHWKIIPISRRTPVKIEKQNIGGGTLDAFMS